MRIYTSENGIQSTEWPNRRNSASSQAPKYLRPVHITKALPLCTFQSARQIYASYSAGALHYLRRFQQNPACQRRHWRAVLAEQLPQLQTIDGDIISLEGIQRKLPVGQTEALPAPEELLHPVSRSLHDEPGSSGVFPQQQALEHQQFLLHQQLQLSHPTKSTKGRSIVQSKPEALTPGGLQKNRQPQTVPEVVSLNLGIVGTGAPGISPNPAGVSLLSRRDTQPETTGI